MDNLQYYLQVGGKPVQIHISNLIDGLIELRNQWRVGSFEEYSFSMKVTVKLVFQIRSSNRLQ